MHDGYDNNNNLPVFYCGLLICRHWIKLCVSVLVQISIEELMSVLLIEQQRNKQTLPNPAQTRAKVHSAALDPGVSICLIRLTIALLFLCSSDDFVLENVTLHHKMALLFTSLVIIIIIIIFLYYFIKPMKSFRTAFQWDVVLQVRYFN